MSVNCTRMLQFSRQLEKFYTHQFSRFLERTGLSMREVHVLLFLANNPDHDTARDVTECRGISKSQVSQAVELLVVEGFLCRRPDGADRRVVRLSITPEGLPLARECQAIQAACWQQLLEGLTPEQEDLLHTLFETVLRNSARLSEGASV